MDEPRTLFVSPGPLLAGAVVALLAAAAISAPLIAPQNPYDLAQLSLMDSGSPPLSTGADGNLFLLGTDDQGRDIFSAILYGLRTSLPVRLSPRCSRPRSASRSDCCRFTRAVELMQC